MMAMGPASAAGGWDGGAVWAHSKGAQNRATNKVQMRVATARFMMREFPKSISDGLTRNKIPIVLQVQQSKRKKNFRAKSRELAPAEAGIAS
jgi:hypothetical protein